MRQEMTRKERILAAINHQPTDKPPVDYWGVEESTQNLIKHFGTEDFTGVCDILGIDKVINIGPRFLGRPDGSDMWGIKYKYIAVNGGVYTEPESFPLGGFDTIEEIEENYIWPSVEMFDYSNIVEDCKHYSAFALEGGYTSLTNFYQTIRGTEEMLVDMLANEELAQYIFHKLQEFSYEHARRILDAADGRIDISQVTDDFGTQSSLIMSPEMIDSYLGTYYDKNIALVKSYGAHVFHHDDGAMMDIMPWLHKKGIELLNPLQWRLPGWNLTELKAIYGADICFHGGVDNQHVLPFGTVEEVRAEVFECLDKLYCDKTGFIIAPCHNVQALTPVENIIAMYDAIKEYRN